MLNVSKVQLSLLLLCSFSRMFLTEEEILTFDRWGCGYDCSTLIWRIRNVKHISDVSDLLSLLFLYENKDIFFHQTACILRKANVNLSMFQSDFINNFNPYSA